MDAVETARAKLLQSSSSWDDLWRDGVTPWDLGKPTPLLIHELEKERPNVSKSKKKQRRTLVPGCGRGYDLLTLQSHHNYMAIQQQNQNQSSTSESSMETSNNNSNNNNVVVGLDMSPTALTSAEALIQGHVSHLTRLDLQCGDFFDPPENWETVYCSREEDDNKGDEQQPPSSVSQFDFIFDYTFFCALPPNRRYDWGTQIAKLLDPTNGRLLTVIFPILPDAPLKGPPYPVCPQDYVEALLPHGIVMDGAPFESPLSVPSRAGKEMVCYWKFGRQQQPKSAAL